MKVLQTGSEYDLLKDVTIIPVLPVGNYELCIGTRGRIYLNKTEDIELPSKIYSNDTDFITHVLHSWKTCDGNLGVGLIGKKGLGKSFTGNIIAEKASVPVIRILNNPGSPDILRLLDKIEQDFILYIDEFEKIFPSEQKMPESFTQQDFLSFLDNGSDRKHKIMFIITANDPYKINDFLKNRPSRLKYFREYETLGDPVIREIVNDLLQYKEHKEDLLENLPYEGLNMDVLIQIIKEINTHNKPYSSFKSFFNFSAESYRSIDIYTIIDEKEYLIKEGLRGAVYAGDFLGRTVKGVQVYSNHTIRSSEITDMNLDKVYQMYYYPSNDDDAHPVYLPMIVKPVVNKLATIF